MPYGMGYHVILVGSRGADYDLDWEIGIGIGMW
jgi:hypothetical protein